MPITKKINGGLFIAFEGGEACGKSTLIQEIVPWLESQGHEVVLAKEPGGTPYGQAAREVFLTHHQDLVPEAELALLISCKKQLLETVIKPALARGAIVICDRYTNTLIAYQGYAKRIERGLIRDMLNVCEAGLPADVVVYPRVTTDVALERIEKRRKAGGEYSSFDAASYLFHARVRGGMDDQIDKRFEVVDADQKLPRVIDDVKEALTRRLHDRRADLEAQI